MMNSQDNVQVGSSRPMTTATAVVGINEERVNQVANISTTVLLTKYPSIGAPRDRVYEFNKASLEAALAKAINPEHRLDKALVVPAYYDTVIDGLGCKIRRTVVSAQPTDTLTVIVPDGYNDVRLQLMALGIRCNRPRNPLNAMSQTLACNITTIDEVESFVGTLGNMVIDDLVRRALIDISEQDQKMLSQLIGELDLQYGEVDNTLMNYFTAAVKSV